MTKPAQFDAAVNAAERWLREQMRVGETYPFSRTEPGEWKLQGDLEIIWVPADEKFPLGCFTCSEDAARKLFSMCEKDPAAWDLCKKIALHRFLTRDHLPDPLREFIYTYMNGILKEPRRQRRALTWVEHATIYVLTCDTKVEFELMLTRNDEPTGHGEGFSACDAVSEALGRCGIDKSYRAVKEICVGRTDALMRQEVEEGSAAHFNAGEQGT